MNLELAAPPRSLWSHHTPRTWRRSFLVSVVVHGALLALLVRSGLDPIRDVTALGPDGAFGGGGGGGGGEEITYFELSTGGPPAGVAVAATPAPPPDPADEGLVAPTEPVTEIAASAAPVVNAAPPVGVGTADGSTDGVAAAGPAGGVGAGAGGPGSGGGSGTGQGPGAGAGVGPGTGDGAPRPLHLVVPRLPRGVEPRRGRGAIVQLLVEVLPDGTVGDARVERGSGVPALDTAALDAARRMRYAPLESDAPRVKRWARAEIRF
ncbi:MAG: energy transducer TonB [Gemmatimonadota bacterium]